MRTLIVIATLAITLVIDARGSVQAAPWCAWLSDYRGFLQDCSYYTFEQCLATIRGNGGYCDRNLHAEPLPYPPARYRKKLPRIRD